MLDALKFVQGSLDRKGLVEEFTHYRIRDGFVMGYNGRVSMCCPIETDLDITPKGLEFAKALHHCHDTVALSVTGAGRVSIRSGPFRSLVPQSEKPFPEVQPSGEPFALPEGFLLALKMLLGFTAEDASRPWSQGIFFAHDKAYATNNVVVCDMPLGTNVPYPVNIPKYAIREMLRIGTEPESCLVDKSSVSFIYGEDKWLRSNLLSCEWPNVPELMDSFEWGTMAEVTPEFLNAVETITSFTGDVDRALLTPDTVCTHSDDQQGTAIQVETHVDGACGYNATQLHKCLSVATSYRLGDRHGHFTGENGLRGVIAAMRF